MNLTVLSSIEGLTDNLGSPLPVKASTPPTSSLIPSPLPTPSDPPPSRSLLRHFPLGDVGAGRLSGLEQLSTAQRPLLIGSPGAVPSVEWSGAGQELWGHAGELTQA